MQFFRLHMTSIHIRVIRVIRGSLSYDCPAPSASDQPMGPSNISLVLARAWIKCANFVVVPHWDRLAITRSSIDSTERSETKKSWRLAFIPWFWRFFVLGFVLSVAVLVIVIDLSFILCARLCNTSEYCCHASQHRFHRSIILNLDAYGRHQYILNCGTLQS
jgi:hypothetical protein